VQSTISPKEMLRWVPIWNLNKNVKKYEGFLLEPYTIDSLEIWMAKCMFWLQIEDNNKRQDGWNDVIGES
jgi:hypothetical protein